ncbi:MAG TPA: ribosome maturation factor RimP [Synergistaceae bacterium]|nr:ribosome maturation factor RimP [Synergistaceae bacterium]HPJ25231.1 ribosome maturation factor RimP [Synergistaceae bacterium]HPQ36102.1 ribosome maturation factor RimP [Synergistaceae bacterium]
MQTSHSKGIFPREEITRTVESLGYECVGIQKTKEHDRTVIRVYIDSLGGITIKDCEMVSRKISLMLDEENFDEELGRYFLEVSSPGVERPLFTLRDYARFPGEKVQIFLREKESFIGILQNITEEGISLLPEGEEVPLEIPFENIERGHLVFEFEVKQHAHKPKTKTKNKSKSGSSKKKKRKK